MASDRLRIGEIVKKLVARNHQVIFQFQIDPTADIFIFNKYGHLKYHFTDPEIAKHIRQLGKPIIYDICDNYFEFFNPWNDPSFPAQWQEVFRRTFQMCRLASHITCTTSYLQQLIQKQNFGVPVTLIHDTYEYPEIPPEINYISHPCLLWFGHSTNILPLIYFQQNTQDRYLVTALVNNKDRILDEIYMSGFRFQNLTLMSWDYNLVMDQARSHDLVIIPQLDNKKTRGKGPCRLMTALRLGLFPVVSPMPAYQSYRDYAYVSDDLEEGIRWFCQNPHLAEEKVRQGQIYLRENFSPEIITDQWEQLFYSISGGSVSDKVVE